MAQAYNQSPRGNPNARQDNRSNYSRPSLIDGSTDFDPVDAGKALVEQIDKRRGFTTSQLRKILSSAAVVKNKIDRESSDTDKLSKSLQDEIQYLRLKLVYQMGRDNNVRIGLSQTTIDLPAVIKNIGDSKAKFDRFYRLLESIVAYRKFDE